MEEDRDILGKADALLRRHVPPRSPSREGADVPVLTELITPGETPPAAKADSGGGPTANLAADIAKAVESRLVRDLERRLTQQVAADVQAGIAAAVEEFRQEIADAVRAAVAEALAGRGHR